MSLDYNHTCFYYVVDGGFGLPLTVFPDWVGSKPPAVSRGFARSITPRTLADNSCFLWVPGVSEYARRGGASEEKIPQANVG